MSKTMWLLCLLATTSCKATDGGTDSPRDHADSATVDSGEECGGGDSEAKEVCDGLDNDCDGLVDDGVLLDLWIDADGDTYGSAEPVEACAGTPSTSTNNLDCNDASGAIHPGAAEVCGDAIDDDCDGVDVVCGFSGEYDLSEASATLTCIQPGDLAGGAMEAGDVTGDGVEDILVATIAGAHAKEAAYVVPGPVLGDGDLDIVGYRIETAAGPAGAGDSPSIGDINGDGFGDLGLGAPYAEPSGQYVVFGPITSDVVLSPPDLALTTTLPLANGGLGAELADIDDDGFDDAIVGATADSASGYSSETIFIVRGPLAGGAVDLSTEADSTIAGGTMTSIWATAIEAGADIDGDGVGDLVVGVPNATGKGFSPGGAHVVYGPASIAGMADADGFLVAPTDDAQAGRVLAVGDYDGDGLADVATSGSRPVAAVYIVDGPANGYRALESADSIIISEAIFFGWRAIASGDVDHDGVDELLIGDPYHDHPGDIGITYLVIAPPIGTSNIADDVARASFSSVGRDASGFGLAVGDVSGDGWGDIVIGAPFLGAGGGVYVENYPL